MKSTISKDKKLPADTSGELGSQVHFELYGTASCIAGKSWLLVNISFSESAEAVFIFSSFA